MYSIGLDVSKSTINVYVPYNDLDLVIKNNIKSLKSLYSKLKKYYKKEFDKLVFIYEPTSSYSFLLKSFCANKNIKSFIVNPKKSASFAKVMGHRNKTDIKDARLLSKMIVTAKNEDIKVPIINSIEEELKELIACYKLIIKQQVIAKNHIAALKAKREKSYSIKELELQYQFLKKQELKLIKQIKSIIKKDEKLQETFKNLQTIDGIGEISSIVLLSHFTQYPTANQKQIVSLAGLDPIEKSSGSSVKGKTKISKAGSKICRGTLFMPAMTSIRHNERLKSFYDRLKENGKHTTVIQVAIMRKLLIIAHSIYKNNEIYDSNKI
ncbi:IS110 family transposase [Halarcobacter ebronensis]|uniref:IS110 family transposase n=1 Tax=Halarcobacter ebronensis TaxID=1462615 RepID=A0A4Q0Y9B7_9BACT|nr:IS110 family transposase [Halarcobacter ebronensis]RXJ66475.1 IS110 family transposase [Halarcobacter ebronensis]